MKKKPEENKTISPIDFPLQDRVWTRLSALRNKIPAVLIFSGPPGVGKFHHAQLFFQSLVCASLKKTTLPCGECVSCLKVVKNNHPDFFVIEPEGEQIQIENIAPIGAQIRFSPLEATYRFIIIKNAHKLNHSSSNALLKTLEEPPLHTRFFLLTPDRQLLLPTINSRAQNVFFSPLEPAAIEHILNTLLVQNEISISSSLKLFLLKLCGDGASRIPLLLEPQNLALLAKAQQDPKALHEDLSGELTTERLTLVLDIFTLWFSELAFKAARKEKRWSFIKLVEESCLLKKRLTQNSNKKLIALRTSQFITEMRST